jgi:hypothetical protein
MLPLPPPKHRALAEIPASRVSDIQHFKIRAFVRNLGSNSSMRRMSITPRPRMTARGRYMAPYDLPDEVEEVHSLTVISFSNGSVTAENRLPHGLAVHVHRQAARAPASGKNEMPQAGSAPK